MYPSVSYIFGLIAMIAGLLGVPLGSFLGQKLRVRYQRADPIVCGMGMLFSTPLMLAALFVAGLNTTACFVIIFFGQVLLNLNWAIVADILLVRDQMPFLFPPFDGCGPFLKNYSRFLFNNSCLSILVHRHSNKTIDCRSVPNSILARAG